jgi:site-specific DNA recombinase
LKCALYARVSSKAQAEKHTIGAQLRVLRAFVAERGWPLIGEYIDDGRTAKSGHLEKREGFARLARDAELGRFQVVVVFDLDRLTRSEEQGERGQILGVFNRAGVKVALATTGQVLDLRTWEGDLYSSFQAVAAADWLRKHRERIMAGKLKAIADGKKPAGPTPFGYTYSRAAGWAPHPEQAAVVREIFERVARGETCQAIADDLAERGLERPRGGAWSPERTWQIVVNRTFLGEWIADKERNLRMPVPQLVPDDLWYAAQTALARHRKRGLRRTKHVYLIEGLAVCGFCGAPIGISSHGGTHAGPYPRAGTYVCSLRRRRVRGRAPCTLPHRKVAEVDKLVWDGLRGFAERRDIVEDAVALLRAQAGQDDGAWRRDLEAAKTRLARLQRAEAAILARFRRGLVSEAAMDSELEASARERAMAERQVAAAQRGTASAVDLDARAAALDDAWRGLGRQLAATTLAERRELVQLLLGSSKIILTPTEVRSMVRLRTNVGLGSRASSISSDVLNDKDVVEFPLVLRSAG